MGLFSWFSGGDRVMPEIKVAKDPVCGMAVKPEEAAATSEFRGMTYYFCAPGCKKSFDQNPLRYLGKGREAQSGLNRSCC